MDNELGALGLAANYLALFVYQKGNWNHPLFPRLKASISHLHRSLSSLSQIRHPICRPKPKLCLEADFPHSGHQGGIARTMVNFLSHGYKQTCSGPPSSSELPFRQAPPLYTVRWCATTSFFPASKSAKESKDAFSEERRNVNQATRASRPAFPRPRDR